jgi:hypothetical protein
VTKLTSRCDSQTFYQLVSVHEIENCCRDYQRVSRVLTKARDDERIDFDWIGVCCTGLTRFQSNAGSVAITENSSTSSRTRAEPFPKAY